MAEPFPRTLSQLDYLRLQNIELEMRVTQHNLTRLKEQVIAETDKARSLERKLVEMGPEFKETYGIPDLKMVNIDGEGRILSPQLVRPDPPADEQG